MKATVIFIIISISLALSGCATMIRGIEGSTVSVPIKTIPEGANVLCKGQQSMSPTVLELDIKKNYVIAISKEGFKTVKLNLGSKPSGKNIGTSFLANTAVWGWWNLGIGTVVGMVVDATSGAMDDIDTKGIIIYLEAGEGEIIMDDTDLIKAAKQRAKENEVKDKEDLKKKEGSK